MHELSLLSDSDIILMDDPFSGLDEPNKNKITGIIKELAIEKILIIALHDADTLDGLDYNLRISL